jgi:osmotically-inducible protein OsmY
MRASRPLLTILCASIPAVTYAAETNYPPTGPSDVSGSSITGNTAPEGNGGRIGTHETREDLPRGITAENQSSDPKAIEITRSIRRKIVERKDLSTSAKNVKIITDDQGVVTLRGPVRDPKERQEIEQIAKTLAASGKVNNQIVVAHSGEGSTGEESHG